MARPRSLLQRVALVLGLLVAAVAQAVWPSISSAQTGQNVLVVANANIPESVEIADYYARARVVPAEQVLKLPMRFAVLATAGGASLAAPASPPNGSASPAPPPAPTPDEISRLDYDRQIESPIAQWIARNQAHDRVLFIVLTKGVPLRIAGTTGRTGTVSSVDSELALLYRKMTGRAVPPGGAVDNPYFLGDGVIDAARPFTHEAFDIFLVTRLDGFSVADVKGLIDRAQSAGDQGRVVLDMKAAIADTGNQWLESAAARLEQMGLKERVVLETSSDLVKGQTQVVGHYWWGSNDPNVKSRTTGLGFVPGAIAASYVSSDGRTFTEPPATWTIGRWDNRAGFFAGSPQSLAGDLIREGVTGVAAQVAEPFLDRAVRPQSLFPAYLSGFTLAEAFYLAMPALSWQTVVVGDPLCRVVSRPGSTQTDPDAGIDPATELPKYFAPRRLEGLRTQADAALRRPAVEVQTGPGGGARTRTATMVVPLAERNFDPRALTLAARGESRLARGDRDGGREALEEATALEPRLIGSQLALASMHARDGDHARSVERFRLALEANPDDTVALNDLAYLLATIQNKPAEALPLAERAYSLSRGAPMIADTVGWVHYLLGNLPQASRYISEARHALPHNPEVRFHVSALAFAAGSKELARRELGEALRLDTSLAGRADVSLLAEKLGVVVPPPPPRDH